ncbi:MAG TPA: hypothetical protein VJI32_00515 [Candidatus Nanoarchaeia archaeon]|nr:hypothetical protein [Candidatus Nanoarchaeia archaeon]
MQKFRDAEQIYDSCLADGLLKQSEEENTAKIKSLLENAAIHLSTADIVAKALHQNSKEWMDVFTLHYEALRTYAEALLLFEKIKSSNHQCLLAALCVKFPQLELDWQFLDIIRTKRHGINYYGERITYQDWKIVEIQVKLYASTLRKEIEERLKENS